MAVSYKQRQEEQVHAPPANTPHLFPASSYWSNMVSVWRWRGQGPEAGMPHQVRPYLAVRQAGGGIKGSGVNVQRCASVAHQQTAAALSPQRSV